MLSRPLILLLGGAAIAVFLSLGFSVLHNRSSTLTSGAARRSLTATKAEEGIRGPLGVIDADPVSPPARGAEAPKELHTLLDEFQRLGPEDRDTEDEIRCALLTFLAHRDPGEILRSLSVDEQQSEFGVAALSCWMQHDGLAASAWLGTRTEPTIEQVHATAAELARKPDQIDTALALQPRGARRDALRRETIGALLPDDPQHALALAEGFDAPTRRQEAITAIAQDWASRDPDGALRWIETVSTAELRDRLVVAAAPQVASVDALRALEWSSSVATSADRFIEATNRVLSVWRAYAPESAERFTRRSEIVNTGSPTGSSTAPQPFHFSPPNKP